MASPLLVLSLQVFGRNKMSWGVCDSFLWEGVGRGFSIAFLAQKPLPAVPHPTAPSQGKKFISIIKSSEHLWYRHQQIPLFYMLPATGLLVTTPTKAKCWNNLSFSILIASKEEASYKLKRLSIPLPQKRLLYR